MLVFVYNDLCSAFQIYYLIYIISICDWLTAFVRRFRVTWPGKTLPCLQLLLLAPPLLSSATIPFFFLPFSSSFSSLQITYTNRILNIQKFKQVFSIYNVGAWMVSTCTFISKSTRLCTYPLVTVPNAPFTIRITVRSRNLSLFSPFVTFNLWRSSLFGKFPFFFLLTITRSGRLAEIKGSVCLSKSQRSFCVTFSRMDSRLFIYHLFVLSNLNFLHNSQ